MMASIEKDFGKFLIEIGYSNYTANLYPHRLNQFALENGYTSLIDLADDVFILLDQGIHGDRKFNDEQLSKIHKYKNVLTLFNSFLFDIQYKRKFVVSYLPPKGCFGLLSTAKPYIPGVSPRILIDIDNNGPTNKQYFGMKEVMAALHIDEKTLKRWDNKDKEGKLKAYFPHRYKGNEKGDIDLTTDTTEVGIYNFYYYRLDELNDFLEYQFKYCKGKKREQYLSDTDIRKSKKRNR